MANNRITFLDSAKGVCMVLIVCSHTDALVPVPMAHLAQTSAFFLLSGYFFSTRLGWKEHFVKTVKTILVPFLFFYILSYVLFYLGRAFMPGFSEMTAANGILDCFTQKQYFNGPLWFLLSLFWVRLAVYAIVTLLKRVEVQMAVSLCLGGLAYFLSKNGIDLPLSLDTALFSVPIFHLGHLARRYDILSRPTKPEACFLAVVFYLSCMAFPVNINNSLNIYDGGYVWCMYVSVILSLAIVLASKGLLFKEQVLSFIGRHTMWIMCTHHLVYRPVKLIVSHFASPTLTPIIVLLTTLMICCLSAPYAERYFPVIVGKPAKH